MDEWNEDMLDKEMESLISKMPKHEEDLEKVILQKIKRRIRKIVLRTMAIVAVIIVCLFMVINPILNKFCFNPYEMNKGNQDSSKLYKVMRDYIEITRPYRELTGIEVEKKGFGRYHIEMAIQNTADYRQEMCGYADSYDMNCGKACNVKYDKMMAVLGRFEMESNKEEEIEKISELPKSAKIYLSVSGHTVKKIDELRANPISIEWVQVYQPDVEFQGGIKMERQIIYGNEPYAKDMNEKELLELYCSKLKSLIDNKKVWSVYNLYDENQVFVVNYATHFLEDTYESAKKLTSLKVKNYCVFGKRDDVIQFLKENEIDSIRIENVQLW